MRWGAAAAKGLLLLLGFLALGGAVGSRREGAFSRDQQTSPDTRQPSVTTQDDPDPGWTNREASSSRTTAQVTDDQEPLFSLEKFDTIDTRLLESFVRPYTRQEEDGRNKRKVDFLSSFNFRMASQRPRASSSRSIQSNANRPVNQDSSTSSAINSDRRFRLEIRDTRNMLKLLHGMPSEFKKRFISLLMHSDRSGLSQLVREMITFHMSPKGKKESKNINHVSSPPLLSRGKSVSTPRTSTSSHRPPAAKSNFLPSFQFNARQGSLQESGSSSKERAVKLPVIESAVILHREMTSEPGRVVIPLNAQAQKLEGMRAGPFSNVHGDFVPSNNPLAKVTTASREKHRNAASSSPRLQSQAGKRHRSNKPNVKTSNPVPRPRIQSTVRVNNNFGQVKQSQTGTRQRSQSRSPGQPEHSFDTKEFSHLLEQVRHSPAFDRIMGNILAMLKEEQKLSGQTSNVNKNKGKSVSPVSSINDEIISSSISSQDLADVPPTAVFIQQKNESNSQVNGLLSDASPTFVPEEDILHGEVFEDGLTTIETRINAELHQSTSDAVFDAFSPPDQSFPPSSANLLPSDNTFDSGNTAADLQSNDFSPFQFPTSSANAIPNDNTFATDNSEVNLQSTDFSPFQFPPSSANSVPNGNTNFAPGHSEVNLQSTDFSPFPFQPPSANSVPDDGPFESGNFAVNLPPEDLSSFPSSNLVPNGIPFSSGNSAANPQSTGLSSSQFTLFNPSQADPLLPPASDTRSSFGFSNLEPQRIVPLSTDLGGQFFEKDIVNFRKQTTASTAAQGSLRNEEQFSFDDQLTFVPLSTDFDGQLDGFPLQEQIPSPGDTTSSLSGGATLPEDIVISNNPVSETGPADDFGLAIGDFGHRPFDNFGDQGATNQVNDFQLDGHGFQFQNSTGLTFPSAPGIPIPSGGNNPLLSSSGVDSFPDNQLPVLPDETGTFRDSVPSQSTSDIAFPASTKGSSSVTFGDLINSQTNTDSDKEFLFPNHSPEVSIMSDRFPSESGGEFRSFGEPLPDSSFTDDFLTGDFVDLRDHSPDPDFAQPGSGQPFRPIGVPLPGLNRSMSEVRGIFPSIGVPLPGFGSTPNNFITDISNFGTLSIGVPLPGIGSTQNNFNTDFSNFDSQSIGVPLPGLGSTQNNINANFSNFDPQSIGVPLLSGGGSLTNTFGNQFVSSNQGINPTNFRFGVDSTEAIDSFETSDVDSFESDERVQVQKDFAPATQAFKNNLSSFAYDAVDATGYPEETLGNKHRFVTFLTPGLIYPYSGGDALYQGGSGLVQQYNLPQQYLYPSQGYNVPQAIPQQYLQPSINSGHRVPTGYFPPAGLAHYDGRRKHKQIPSSTYTVPPPVPGSYDSYDSPQTSCLSRTVVLTTVLIEDKPASVTTILDRVTSVHMVDRFFVSPVTVLQPYPANTATFNNYYGQIHTKTIAATPYTPAPGYVMDQTVHVGQPALTGAAYTPQPNVDYSPDVVGRAGHYGPVSRMVQSTFYRTLSTRVPKTIVATRSLVSTISYGQTLTTIRSTSVFCIEPAPPAYHGPDATYRGASAYNPRTGTPPLPLYTQNVAASYNAPLVLPHATYPSSPSLFRTWVGSLVDDDEGTGYDGVPRKFVLLQHMWPKAFVFGDGSSEGYTRINLTPGNPYVGGVNRRLELPVDEESESLGKGKSLVTIHQPLIQSSLRH